MVDNCILYLKKTYHLDIKGNKLYGFCLFVLLTPLYKNHCLMFLGYLFLILKILNFKNWLFLLTSFTLYLVYIHINILYYICVCGGCIYTYTHKYVLLNVRNFIHLPVCKYVDHYCLNMMYRMIENVIYE